MKICKRIAAMLLVAIMCLSYIPAPAHAATPDDLIAVGGVVTLDGVNDGTVTVAISTPEAIGIYAVLGNWSIAETEGKNYLTLTAIGSDKMTFNGDNSATIEDGEVWYIDDNFNTDFAANTRIMYATYRVAANTPKGEYTVTFDPYMGIIDEDLNEYYDVITFTVTVEHAQPACDHQGKTYTYETNNNGTHKVKCECGEYKTESEACSDDATDNNHACDFCGYSVGLETCSDKAGDDNHNCDVCNAENVSDHSYGNASCETAATCTECGATTGTVLGHKDDNHDHNCDNGCGKVDMGEHKDAADDKDHVCDYGCGATLEGCSDETGDGNHNCDVCNAENVSDHSYGTATCDAAATCTECGATTGTALGHKDDNHDHNCDNGCGKVDMGEHKDAADDKDHVCDYGCGVTLEDCSGGEATCTAKAKCEKCGQEYGELAPDNHKNTSIGTVFHSDGNGNHYQWLGCSDCKNAEIQKVNVTPCSDSDDDKDHNCDYCKTTNIEGHTNGAPVQENIEKATCEVAGSYDEVIYCTECGAVVSRENKAIDALGHEWDATTYTWSEDGKSCTAKHVCARDAAHEETETVATTGKITTPATCTEMGTTTYTANFEAEWAVDGQTKEVQDIPANKHSFTNARGNLKTAGTCTAEAVYAVKCDNCSAESDELTVKGEKDTSNHTGEIAYTDNNDGTHKVTCKTCGETLNPAEAHDYNYDSANHKCICGLECSHNGGAGGTDKGNGTHDLYCFCGKFLGNEPHFYNPYHICYACLAGRTGWHEGCYYKNAVLQKTEWTKIDDAWYYLDPVTGKYATGLRRLPYLTELGYAPNQEDIDYAANKGTAFKDATEAWFYFDQDGKLMTGFTGILDGKYVQNGMIPWHPGFVEVDGVWYYFVGDAENGGNKMANGQIYVTRNAEQAGYKTSDQIVFVNGRVDTTVDGIVSVAGVLYYYENGKLMAGNGLTKIGDKYIYVRSSGKLAVGEYYIPANDLGVVSALYTFGEDGYMVNPNTDYHNGVVNGYYYKDGKVQYGAGLIEWKGDIYYVRSNGQVATGWYYVTNTNGMEGFQKGMKLNFGEDGKLQPVKNGIVEENGELYYYENNHVRYGAGLLKLEDENGVYYIYVRSSGKVQTGYFYITKTNGLEGFEVGDHCRFGEDGKLIQNFDKK